MIGLRGTTRGEPDQGYDAKAAEWRAKLPSETTTQPASQSASAPKP